MTTLWSAQDRWILASKLARGEYVVLWINGVFWEWNRS